jgi:hypothetical protein
VRVIHLTPFGLGRPLPRAECRAARAPVAESIRTRLVECRARRLLTRQPSELAVLGQRLVARRRTMLVVSDGAPSATLILLAATVRASTPHAGRLASVCHSVVRRLRMEARKSEVNSGAGSVSFSQLIPGSQQTYCPTACVARLPYAPPTQHRTCVANDREKRPQLQFLLLAVDVMTRSSATRLNMWTTSS